MICSFIVMVKVFEATSQPGYIRIDTLLKALTTYGSDKLTEEQARELVSQVRIASPTIQIIVYYRICNLYNPSPFFSGLSWSQTATAW